jgi:AhpD family alkylhydroperoxidase
MRFITGTSPRAAEGLTADVYQHIKRDFHLKTPFFALSPVPELLAGAWTALYESVLVEHRVNRRDKEAIVTAVSEINECQFCVEAHTVLGTAAGGEAEPALVEWARATRSPASPVIHKPPFSPEEGAEVIGTALVFHFINRVVTVFHGLHGMAPLLGPLGSPVGRLAALSARGRTRRRYEAGQSLHFLAAADLSEELGWARPVESIAAAWGRFEAAAERAAESVVSEPVAGSVQGAVGAWDGADPPLGKAWISEAIGELGREDQPVASLALLSALAPYRVEPSVVEEFRVHRPTDRELVATVGFGAFAAARRIGTWLTPEHALHPAQTPSARSGTAAQQTGQERALKKPPPHASALSAMRTAGSR